MGNCTSDSSAIQPVVIIGAARSGTNMLRDVLTQLPSVGSWPFDETNYLWQSCLAEPHHDELTLNHANASAAQRVKRAVHKLARKEGCRWIIEKSCVNSLRVGYINAMLPHAKFIFIVRDGRDVVLSSSKKWSEPTDSPQFLKRLSYLPVQDLPHFCYHFFSRRLRRRFSRAFLSESLPGVWGPRFRGISEVLKSSPVEEVCALQWKHSVEKAASSLQCLSDERVYAIKYEDFVNKPVEELSCLLKFLEIEAPLVMQQDIVSSIFSTGVGRWRTQMSAECLARIESLVGETLESFGYPYSEQTPIFRVA